MAARPSLRLLVVAFGCALAVLVHTTGAAAAGVASAPAAAPAAAAEAAAQVSTAAGDLELIILHNNDMHARFEQTGKYSNTCQPADVTGNRCYGGFARVAYKYARCRRHGRRTDRRH